MASAHVYNTSTEKIKQFTVEQSVRNCRRRCKSEGLEINSSYERRFEQSYAAEAQRPLSRCLPQVARTTVGELHCQETNYTPVKVRLPSPGRKPFQNVNATDLQYFNGRLPSEGNFSTHSKRHPCYTSHQEGRINGYNSHGNSPAIFRKQHCHGDHRVDKQKWNVQDNGLSNGFKKSSGQFNSKERHPDDYYLEEVEALRSKLNDLQQFRGGSEGKRVRQHSDSDTHSATTSPPDYRFSHSITRDVKRPREHRCAAHRSIGKPLDSKPVCNGNEDCAVAEPIENGEQHLWKSASSALPACERVPKTCSHIKSQDAGDSGIESTPKSEQSPVDQEKVEAKPVKKVREYPGPHSLASLRPSLFSHVPPYLRFSLHDEKGPALPPLIQRYLKWNLSAITPLVVRRTVINSNYRLIRKSNEWTATWGKHMKSINFKVLKEYQKINHFPGTFQIGRKDRLWKNLLRLITKFGKKEFGFIPRTYVLPQDNKLLRAAWERGNSKEAWIIKPPASARGTGIKVIHRWGQIPKKRPLIVQKYIDRPYLINGCKFDLRLYILVTSIHPLRIYMYDDGLVRFASVKYSEDPASLADRYMHLTNYSINKLSSHYTQNEDESACKGHKWTIKSLWKYFERNNVDVDSLWDRLLDLAIKTVISGEASINQLSRAHLNSRYCCYELFGLDVLFDQDLRPWLLEVNISPSLHSSSPLDLAVKGPMVRDLMNMAGHQIPCKLSPLQQEELVKQYNWPHHHTLCMDKRLYTVNLSPEERSKHMIHQQANCREEYLPTILKDLTPDDVRHLIQYEDELTQCGRFQKIFPTPFTHEYHQFFEFPRYYNMMLDAWETKYHSNRQEGVHRLEELCQEKLHLQVPLPSSRTKCSPNQLSFDNETTVSVDAGGLNTSSSCHQTPKNLTKKTSSVSSSKSGHDSSGTSSSPTSPLSPSSSPCLHAWSSARFKLSAARLRSHKLLTHRSRPSGYISRLSRLKSTAVLPSNLNCTKNSTDYTEMNATPSISEELHSITATSS